MTHENEIPEYALQPAKAPKATEAEAVYHTEKIVCPAEEQTVVYQFEEDILVPDIRPDMRDILLMDASCDIMPGEKKVSPKTDDLLNLTGNITIQTLYGAEGGEREPVAITSRVPYKYQWNLNPDAQGEGVFGCRVKNLEHMIINERKFRVKVTLEFSARLLYSRELQFFGGLKEEQLEMKQVQKELTCLALVKKDEVSIDERFRPKDPEMVPETVLKQDFVITENYRQVTTEKVVINGFVFCSLLYSARSTEEEGCQICQHNQRIEFTQFIPIEKEQRGKNWHSVSADFQGRDMNVSVVCDEENPEDISFRIHGTVATRVELYENRQREIAVDAYHREKRFQCDISKTRLTGCSDAVMAETSVREIVNLPEGAKAAGAVYCSARVLDCSCRCEKGKASAEGVLSCSVLWKGQDGMYHAERVAPDFRGSVDMENASAGQKAVCRPLIRAAWAELINEKQLEVNCTILLCAESRREEELVMLEHPRFVEGQSEKEYPMVIVAVKPGETLWDLAKRYRTTEEHIRMANHLESEAAPGQRLLIIK
ncbi:MAG: LysM peptidoglycan-binding domain-containing protein [Emergencia sp.]